MRFYGQTYTSVWVTTRGVAAFSATTPFFLINRLPETSEPNNALYAFGGENLEADASGGIYTAGSASQFVIEYRNVRFQFPWEGDPRVSFSIVLRPDGTITYRYQNIGTGPQAAGGGAVVGIENSAGTDALEFDNRRGVIANGLGVTFRPPA